MGKRTTLHKKRQVMVRLSESDYALLKRAASLESERRGEIVPESSLVRELAMARVRELVQLEAVPA